MEINKVGVVQYAQMQDISLSHVHSYPFLSLFLVHLDHSGVKWSSIDLRVNR